jgi:hypothetical protein
MDILLKGGLRRQSVGGIPLQLQKGIKSPLNYEFAKV